MGKVQPMIEAIHVNLPLAEIVRAQVFRVRVIHLGQRHAHRDFLPRITKRLRGALKNTERIIPPPRIHVRAADTVHQSRVKLILQLSGRHEGGHLAIHVHLSGGRHAALILGGRLVTNHVKNLGVIEFGERPKLLLGRHNGGSRHDNVPFSLLSLHRGHRM